MKIKKVMRRYYNHQLEKIEDYPPPAIQTMYRPENRIFPLILNWEGIFGTLFVAFSILHFILTGRLFAVERLMMAISVVF